MNHLEEIQGVSPRDQEKRKEWIKQADEQYFNLIDHDPDLTIIESKYKK
jgi:hypothetical protein